MSMPSLSWATHIGVIASRAADVSFQRDPAIEPESSIRKIVSKVARKAYWSSVEEDMEAVGLADAGASFASAVGV